MEKMKELQSPSLLLGEIGSPRKGFTRTHWRLQSLQWNEISWCLFWAAKVFPAPACRLKRCITLVRGFLKQLQFIWTRYRLTAQLHFSAFQEWFIASAEGSVLPPTDDGRENNQSSTITPKKNKTLFFLLVCRFCTVHSSFRDFKSMFYNMF